MRYKRTVFMLLAMVLIIAAMITSAQDDVPQVIVDFEVAELPVAIDQFNNAIGFAPWGDTPGNVQLSLAEIEREGETSSVLAVNYDIGAWGGFTHALTDGDNWISQDWTAYGALQFWLYGNNTGGVIQVEIFDNRNPDLNGDSAERWYFRITDDYEGWRQFTLPFSSFQRRTDFQPGGAPNDGLGLDQVSGYAFGFPGGLGPQVAYIDNVEIVKLSVEPIIVDDFEVEELFVGQDPDGNGIGYVAWGDTGGNVELRLTDAKRNGFDTRSLTVVYDIAAWGGFSHVFNDGTDWTTQNWISYNAISFWFLGGNTGAEVQFEIFDNRAPDSTGDSAERFFYRFVDDSYGWKLVEIPLIEFQRRSDWQPDGAPDDGFTLSEVHGYAFGFPAGTGGQFAFIDDIQVVVMPDVNFPVEAVADAPAEEPAQPAEVAINEALLAPMPYAEPIVVSDFESSVDMVVIQDGPAIGYVAWGDTGGNATIEVVEMAISSVASQVLQISYDIGAWGGFTYASTDGADWAALNWSNHNALQFWLYGNNTGGTIQIEILENRAPDSNADSAERYFFHLVDDYEGWQQVTIPFAHFQRRSDWQPGGAPDDGFTLTEVHGYAFGFPAGVGAQTAYIDNVQVVVVEDPSIVTMSGSN